MGNLKIGGLYQSDTMAVIKNGKTSQVQWLTPVILATQEAEVRGLWSAEAKSS
jgi:hypothetical protein